MANNLQYAAIFQTELDKAAKEQATSGWMELNDKLVKYNGGSEVKIPMLDMDGLADYDRQTGFVEGSVDLTWQTKKMTMDRGRQFTFDEQEVNDTAKNRAVYGYTPDESTILKKLYADLASIQDEVGDDTPLVITMSTQVAALFDMNTTLARSVSPTDFQQGDITLKVKSLNGQHPIIRVGSGRLKTSYQFNDGTTENQVKGGFTPAEDAQDINWIICPRSAPIAVSRTDKVRIFDPETYQKKRAWAVDYRKYHDLWVLDNKMNTILVNIKQAKAGA